MRIARMLGRAPRRTAPSPAIPPPAPARTAIHRTTDAASADRCADCRPQGGPRRGRTSRGEFQPFRSTDAAIMTRIETLIPAAASQVSRRTRSALGGTGLAAGDLSPAPVTLRMRLLPRGPGRPHEDCGRPAHGNRGKRGILPFGAKLFPDFTDRLTQYKGFYPGPPAARLNW